MQRILISFIAFFMAMTSVMAETNYLCFTAQEAAKIVFCQKGTLATLPSLQYSSDRSTWNEYTLGESIDVPNGSSVYFRATTTNATFSESSDNYIQFSATGKVAASGNIMSLLDASCQQTTVPAYGFNQLFKDCTTLTTVPELAATTLSEYCYQAMFQGCTAITNAELHARTLTTDCYKEMFSGCTSFNRIVVHFTDWPVSNENTEQWLANTPEEGTFVCLPELEQVNGWNFIPSYWRLVRINPVCFTAQSSTNVAFTAQGTLTSEPSLQYSMDNMTWQDYTLGTAVSLNEGDKVWFSAKDVNSTFCESNSNYIQFTSTGNVSGSGDIISLLDRTCVETTVPAYAFYDLFFQCTTLTSAPALPATTLSKSCYANMFYGCTGLTGAPALPATTMAESCYDNMFDGCSALTAAPELPATTLAPYCYSGMFRGCSAITAAPALPATELQPYCYMNMFRDCTGLQTAPASLPATELKEFCYDEMFKECTSMTSAPHIYASKLASYSCKHMFFDCEKLNSLTVNFTDWDEDQNATYYWMQGVASSGTFLCPDALDTTSPSASTVPEGWTAPHPDNLCFTAEEATTVAFSVEGNGSMENEPRLQYSTDNVTWTAYTLGTDIDLVQGDKVYFRAVDYNGKFYDNIYSGYVHFTSSGKVAASGSIMSLLDNSAQQTSTPEYAFENLFLDCTTLTSAPSLPATELGRDSYDDLFKGCTSLTSAPELPATSLPVQVYYEMFAGCISLTTAPELPATSISNFSYGSMFSGCTALTSAPTLPATTLAGGCYAEMFKGCTSLTTAPKLPATTLQSACYSEMFKGCTSLTTAPALPAASTVLRCYEYMFNGCSQLNSVTVDLSKWGENYWTTIERLDGVSETGTFICPAGLDVSTRGTSTIPEGWTVTTPDYLCFTAEEEATIGISYVEKKSTDIKLQCSTDGTNWESYVYGTDYQVSKGSKIYFRANGTNEKLNTYTEYIQFHCTGKLAASGNIMSLLDPTCQQTTLPSYAFVNLFKDCTGLTTAPELPATQLSQHCYQYMFKNCTSLKEAPALPATQLTNCCYQEMFYRCSSLTKAPELPATQLQQQCYEGMFQLCTGLTEAPELPATSLTAYCYRNMFDGCSHLNSLSVSFTDWNSSGNSTYDWLSDVATTGTFYYPSGLDVTTTTGTSNVPAGWTAKKKPEPLCFTAEEDAKVAFSVDGEVEEETSLSYSTDKTTWQTYTFNKAIQLAKGDKVYFRATTANETFSLSEDDFIHFTASGKVAASGSITSLIDAKTEQTALPENAFCKLFTFCSNLTTAPELPDTLLSDGCYMGMFYYCTGFTTAPVLPAKKMAKYCYSHMFYGCTGLTEAPELPSTELASSCYSGMLAETNITEAPALPATTLANDCYEYMFDGCKNLTEAPELPATTLASGCYENMFRNCSKLSKVSVRFTSWNSDQCTYNWLDGVAETGSFICPDELDVTTTVDASHVPEGWVTSYLPTVTLNAAGYATFSSDRIFSIKTYDVKAYIAYVRNGVITLKAVMGDLGPGIGYILYGTPNTTVAFGGRQNNDVEMFECGNLRATTTDDTPLVDRSTVEGTVWVLGDGNQFLKYKAGLPFIANRGFFVYENASGAKMSMVFADDDVPTATSTVLSQGKVMENTIYNLAGQRVGKDAKGILIINGKKIVR